MNRFRTKKRTKDDVSAPRPSMDSDSASPFKLFGKKRLPESDSKPDLDLDNALPSSDDFRTSLLMTGLSARFSMLREQDDPHSKLGKASDDSVLFPKRQSRLMDFGYASGLQDIAEIESLKASTLTRVNSSQGSEDNDIRSIMDRARPNDGNNLFGGRQKIYRLAAGARPGGNGMGGRILYDEDVAKSAFQKWKQAEKERTNLEERTDDTMESDFGFDYDKKRATNSTTSSGVSAGRNSTAATSIASQAPAAKDSQSAIPPSASNVERSFTRTRRLYEQGLTQDLHDQQSSALSRMDTLSKSQRHKADGAVVPSPTSSIFSERVLERRTILTKGSAPNLRSFTPPSSAASQQAPVEPVPRFPSEQYKPNFGVSPPLSPPISEADDHPMLPIQPNDRGKATAMGVFNRPAQQYDDSKFALRQQQMRKGRDVFDTQSQRGSRSSHDVSRSRSSSMHRSSRDRTDAAQARIDRPGKKNHQATSFFDDSDDATQTSSYSALASTIGVQLSVERPNDEDHPAFRKSALPTPLSLSSRASDDNSSVDDRAEMNTRLREDPPEHSPTLGPGSGLSGMVRQHLRGDSNASSMYDTATQTPDGPSRQQSLSSDSKRKIGNNATHDSWGVPDDELATDGGTWTPTANQAKPTPRGEQDEFARHLADGARRVREKLTSYSEPDNEQPPPALLPSESAKDLAGARSNALGILRTKSSRTSLFDRGRDRDSDTKPKSAKSPAPSARKTSGETVPQEPPVPVPVPKDDGVHAGLKAFRQARRELQRMKELEVQQRHGSPQKPSNRFEHPSGQREFPNDAASPPPQHQPVGFSAKRQGPSERDRSGSDSSRDGRDGQNLMAGRGAAPSSDGRTMMASRPGNHSPTASKRRDVSEPVYLRKGGEQRLRPSTHVGATVSTPNLHAPIYAPPLPPINPRRKNVFPSPTRGSGEQAAQSGYGDGSYEESIDEQRRQIYYRTTRDENGEGFRHYPPSAAHRPPLPHTDMSSNSLPGGMI